jgi:hypothetical protein
MNNVTLPSLAFTYWPKRATSSKHYLEQDQF